MQKTFTRLIPFGMQSAAKSIPLSAFGPELLNGDYNGRPTDVIYYYEHAPWLYRGTNIIADSLGRLKWSFRSPSGEDIDNPKLGFSWNTIRVMNLSGGDLVLYGASYWLRGVTNSGAIKEVRRLHPTRVKPVFDSLLGLIGYDLKVGTETKRFTADQIIAVELPNRKSELGAGTAPAKAALAAAGVLTAIDDMAQSYFAQGAINPTLIALEDQTTVLSDNDLDRLNRWLTRAVSGLKNAFRTEAVRAQLNKIELGSTPDQLEMPGLTDKKREDIATALGVPQSILFSNAANYATSHQDTMNLYDLTITPLAELISDSFNERLFADYGLTLVPHPEQLDAFQALELNKSEGLALARDRNIISVNEYRASIGFHKLNDPQYDALESELDAAALEAPDTAINEELRQWRRAFTKRLKQGKRMTRPFAAARIPETLRASLEGALESVESLDHANDLFADAQAWPAYP